MGHEFTVKFFAGQVEQQGLFSAKNFDAPHKNLTETKFPTR